MGNLNDLTISWEGFTNGDVEDIIKEEFGEVKTQIRDAIAKLDVKYAT